MCRIYAHIANEPKDPSDYLVNSSCSLLAQSTAKKDFQQKDGWGVAAWKGGAFSIFKSEKPIFKETPLLKTVAAKSKSKIVVAHIRAASNPLKLSMKKLIAKEHSQPFGTAKFGFAHNGTLNIAKAAKERLLGSYQSKLKGNNDSEIYFWLLMKWCAETKNNIPHAFIRTTREIWQLWNIMTKSEKKGFKIPYTSFNTALSDGKNLYALCHSLLPPKSTSLCLKDQPYNRLAYRLTPTRDRLVVGSEKLSSQSDWRVLPMHNLLIAQPNNGTIAYTQQDFPWKL